MATDIVMPRLSDSMEEGTILTWLKNVGEEVGIGDELVEIETDKANMAYEADVAGTVLEVLVEAGGTAAIGEPIARVGEPGEAPVRPTARRKASPLARRVAADLRVDLSRIDGSGPDGRILRSDVESAAKPADRSPDQALGPGTGGAEVLGPRGETKVVELTKLQQVVWRRMAESKATAPHFYLEAEIDMSAVVRSRRRIKDTAGDDEVAPSFNDLVVRACAGALREFPRANGAYRDGRWELYSRVNVGIAVAADGVLVVPTIFDADQKGLRQIATESRVLAAKVRAGSITPPELAGATFTVSNLGMYGISNFHAVINQPQAAILAVGDIAERAVVRDGTVDASPVMNVTLSCDHRILYGADAAEFLAHLRSSLEDPMRLVL
jgi:pyruvate dehydrogenase E2 component (dihydrolipoamide acetyltransferase)